MPNFGIPALFSGIRVARTPTNRNPDSRHERQQATDGGKAWQADNDDGTGHRCWKLSAGCHTINFLIALIAVISFLNHVLIAL